ncbi:MAG: D-glycero-beta-D-manno-heptose 1-phosphate adenylyltransferase [Pelagibacterales bacterium]|nr:D-glycero-beta-D-manno-heptose 1-phosphate adenylyltransferase [Pelagibacterales bacterium]|tara:strand:- start:1788 stop:3224 length:1437 start_codon:yes stop_codon:yes gene_type:complete
MLTNSIINLFKKTRVFLVGDIMLDRYVFGKINRISPEAPVPIFLAKSSKEVLGGSGNVLSNLVALGTKPAYLTIIGKDVPGKKIKKLLKNLGFKDYTLIIDKSRKTTVKTRYISNSQQIIRIDEETSGSVLKKIENEFLKKIDNLLKNKDVIVISDYNKGVINKRVCEYIIKRGNSLKIPIIIDPKNKNFDIYKNSTLITPNQLEASRISQMNIDSNAKTEKCGNMIMKKYNIKNVLVTRGDKGLSLITKKASYHSPTISKEVYDVSGAGDTVLALIAASFPNKIEETKALTLANKAAGKVIGRIGTSPISLNELFDNVPRQHYNKIFDIKLLCKKLEEDRKKGFKIGFTNGCFDVLHFGHINCIEKSKMYCDKLVVALNSDISVKKLKGKNRPINNELYRAKILSSLEFCDYVIIFNEKTPLSLIKKIKPDLITKGGDYKSKKIVGENEVKKWGGNVLTLDFVRGLSSTNIIDKLKT